MGSSQCIQQCCEVDEEDRETVSEYDTYMKKFPAKNTFTDSSLHLQRHYVHSTIKEETSFQSSRDQFSPPSWVRFNTEIQSTLQYDPSQLIQQESRSASAIPTGMKVRFYNMHTKGYLSSHLIKSTSIKNGYEVTLAKPQQQLLDYLEWIVVNDSFTSIQHGDIVKIEHSITGNRLSALRNPFTKILEICCTSKEIEDAQDQWKLLPVTHDFQLKAGCGFLLRHLESDLTLTVIKHRAIMKTQSKTMLTSDPPLKLSLWKIETVESQQ